MIPSTVRVGSHVYTVEEKASINKDKRYGECHVGNLSILIRKDTVPSKKREIVLHEILHAAWEAGGLQLLKQVTEEDAVDRFAYVMLGVLRSNPDLVTYLTEE